MATKYSIYFDAAVDQAPTDRQPYILHTLYRANESVLRENDDEFGKWSSTVLRLAVIVSTAELSLSCNVAQQSGLTAHKRSARGSRPDAVFSPRNAALRNVSAYLPSRIPRRTALMLRFQSLPEAARDRYSRP
jgi:hypothetical protein